MSNTNKGTRLNSVTRELSLRMASDVSSGCNEAFVKIDEKEEGEISLEDVSSSEEGQSTYGYENRTSQCPHCLSTQHCATWCTGSMRSFSHRNQNKRDAVQGKENRRYTKDYSTTGTKHMTTTLQEKNEDLLPISSDSDMELVGLADSSKQILLRTGLKTKTKKKRKKKKGGHGPAFTMDDLISPLTNDVAGYEVAILKHDNVTTKMNHSSRSHHRETSSVHKSSRSKALSRSPPRRYRSPSTSTQLSVKNSHSPIHNKPPIVKRSPRRHRSPRRSPCYSPVRTVRDIPKLDSPLPSRSRLDLNEDARLRVKLLRKVKELDSLGVDSVQSSLEKNKERASSLKEKLSNMMKATTENNEHVIHFPNLRPDLNSMKDADEDEDLALLRQKALETKHKKLMKHTEQLKENHDKKAISHNDEEHDEEELRMIALRSAVLKKHQNRVQRGLKLGMQKKYIDSRSESPFGQSFLENIPGEDSSDIQSPHASPELNESMHTEDMDLDTDIEREKEKLPYSPTNNITSDVSIDGGLLSTQLSEVSFITVKETNNTCTYDNMSVTEGCDDLHARIIENKSYLSNVPFYMDLRNAQALSNTNIPYPLPNPTDQSTPNQLPNIAIPGITNVLCNTSTNMQIHNNKHLQDPTNIPVYDPDLPQSLPQLNYSNTFTPIHTSSMHLITPSNNDICNNMEKRIHPLSHLNLELRKLQSDVIEKECSKQVENVSVCTNVGLSPSLKAQLSSNDAVMKINELSNINPNSQNTVICASNAPSAIVCSTNDLLHGEIIQKPLYMQTAVADVTKDANRISTLINRKLVPATILKTNKQLQQSLLIRKSETHTESTSTNVEVQPIVLKSDISNKSSATSKPVQVASRKESVTSDSCVNKNTRHEIRKANNLSKDKSRDNKSADSRKTNNVNDTSSSKELTTNTRKKTVRRSTKHRNSSDAELIKKHTDISLVYKNDQKEKREDSVFLERSTSKPNEKLHFKRLQDNKNDKLQEESSSISKCTSDSIKKNISLDVTGEATNKKRKIDDLIDNNEGTVESKEGESRRESVDDDEETLRATLLASLAKRSKPSSGNSCVTTTVTTSNIDAEVLPHKADKHTISATTTEQNLKNDTIAVSLEKPSTSSHCTSNNDMDSNISVTSNTTNKSVSHVSNKNMMTVLPNSLKKKSNTVVKGPPKKIMKKVSIPASTKVVNNAKKYQNTIIQRKLHLQKAASLYNVQKQIDNKFVTNLRNNENKWTATAKPSVLTDTQRIVISLGSDTDSDSECESEEQKSTDIPITSSKHPNVPIPMEEFEKNLEKLLRDERKKQESAAAAANSTPTLETSISQTRDSANLDTPLAVRRHLPASKQEEYRRLKQQILEREKLRRPTQNNNNNNNNSNNSNTAAQYAKKPSSQISPNPHSKEIVHQSFLLKKQNPNVHSSFCKDIAKNTSDDVHNNQDSSNKLVVPTIVKHLNNNNNTVLLQTNGTKKTMTNFSISVHNENATNDPNIQRASTSETIQKTTLDNSTKELNKNTLPTLRILSKDDLNEKYVQIQVNQETNGRVVTINNRENLNNSTNRSEEHSESKNNVNEETDENISPTQVFDKENINDNTAKMKDNESPTINKSESIISQSVPERDTSFQSIIDSPISRSSSNIIWDDRSNIEEIKAEVNTLLILSQAEQQQHLKENENKLVTKRYVISEDLTEMSRNLRQWDMERDLQMSLVAEVKKLREQLRIAEEKLQEQRTRISIIGPRVMAAHEKINDGCRECFKLTKMCSMLGGKLHGPNYKVPDAGSQLLHNKFKEVASRTRQLSKKKVPFIDISDSNSLTTSTKAQNSTIKTEVTAIEESMLISQNDSADTNETDSQITEDEYNTELLESKDNIDLSLFTATPQNIGSLEIHERTNNSTNRDAEQNIQESDNSANVKMQSCSIPISSRQETVRTLSDPLTQKDKRIKEENSEKSEEVPESLKSDDAMCKLDAEVSQQDFEFTTKKTVEPYVSILSHLKEPRNTNPNGVLCPFELMGTCCDAECQFVHQSNHAQ